MSRMIASYGALPQALERLVSVARLGHVVVFERQRPEQRVLHGGLVVYDQYACLLGHVSQPPRSVLALAGAQSQGKDAVIRLA